MTKYGNIKTIIDGITFDSKKEGIYYLQYKFQEKKGVIKNLKLQVPFPIIINNKKVAKYIADFVYEDETGQHVIDVKSPATAKDKVFRLKKKLVEALYDIEIEVVM